MSLKLLPERSLRAGPVLAGVGALGFWSIL